MIYKGNPIDDAIILISYTHKIMKISSTMLILSSLQYSYCFVNHNIKILRFKPIQSLNIRASKSRNKMHVFTQLNESIHTHENTDTSKQTGGILKARIIDQGENYAIAYKEPSVLCHYSEWAGSKKMEPIPMLQRINKSLNGRRINLIHRLDRGASGCLLCAVDDGHLSTVTKELINALQSDKAVKTYVAIVRGSGMLHDNDLKTKGWFTINRPIKDERGVLNEASTKFNFIAGCSNPRASLILAQPTSGKWHQIRRHLNGLSHPIIGDTVHGNSRTNREWKELRDLPSERLCLHLARLQIPETEYTPALDVCCAIPEDMMFILKEHMSDVLADSCSMLDQCGIIYDTNS